MCPSQARRGLPRRKQNPRLLTQRHQTSSRPSWCRWRRWNKSALLLRAQKALRVSGALSSKPGRARSELRARFPDKPSSELRRLRFDNLRFAVADGNLTRLLGFRYLAYEVD